MPACRLQSHTQKWQVEDKLPVGILLYHGTSGATWPWCWQSTLQDRLTFVHFLNSRCKTTMCSVHSTYHYRVLPLLVLFKASSFIQVGKVMFYWGGEDEAVSKNLGFLFVLLQRNQAILNVAIMFVIRQSYTEKNTITCIYKGQCQNQYGGRTLLEVAANAAMPLFSGQYPADWHCLAHCPCQEQKPESVQLGHGPFSASLRVLPRAHDWPLPASYNKTSHL